MHGRFTLFLITAVNHLAKVTACKLTNGREQGNLGMMVLCVPHHPRVNSFDGHMWAATCRSQISDSPTGEAITRKSLVLELRYT